MCVYFAHLLWQVNHLLLRVYSVKERPFVFSPTDIADYMQHPIPLPRGAEEPKNIVDGFIQLDVTSSAWVLPGVPTAEIRSDVSHRYSYKDQVPVNLLGGCLAMYGVNGMLVLQNFVPYNANNTASFIAGSLLRA